MLWYKAWRETRWRMLMLTGMVLWVLFATHSRGTFQPRPASPLQIIWLLAPLMLAGSGLRTDPVLQPMKGLHGSMYFTLSLPVSRLRLFAVRAGAGLLETAAIIVAVSCTAGILFPELRVNASLAGGFVYVVTVFLCSCGIYGLSTLLATFLELLYQIWAGFAAIFLSLWLVRTAEVPRSIDPFSAMGDLSPLATHVFPWAAIGVSLGLGTIFFLAALRVVQARQY
jgi:hypothetical protein